MKGKIILNLAMSLDGFIADDQGGFSWIKGDGSKELDTEKQFSFTDFLALIDIIVMGKNAFLDAPKEGLDGLKDKKIYVTSHEVLQTSYDNVRFIQGDILSQVKELQEDKNVWIYGGGVLADVFIKADVIDEYIVGIIPIILGCGRPLFLKDNPKRLLKVVEVTVQEGIVIVRYIKRI